MIRTLGLIAASAIAAITLTGCASTGSTAASAPSSAPSSQPPAAAALASSVPCTTKACVAALMDEDALGIVASNMSVVTGAKCRPSTVRHNPGDTWTARCTITYSDNTKGHGLLTLAPDPNNGKTQVAFQPDGT